MPFIDWSDPEEMFGLLIEYITDEKSESSIDRERHKFLSSLLNELIGLNNRLKGSSGTELIDELRKMYTSVDPEFKTDPVILHLNDCIEELERLHQ